MGKLNLKRCQYFFWQRCAFCHVLSEIKRLLACYCAVATFTIAKVTEVEQVPNLAETSSTNQSTVKCTSICKNKNEY